MQKRSYSSSQQNAKNRTKQNNKNLVHGRAHIRREPYRVLADLRIASTELGREVIEAARQDEVAAAHGEWTVHEQSSFRTW